MKKSKEDQIIVSCPKCRHEHKYKTLEALETASLKTPCNACGFLYLHHMAKKMDIITELLQTDQKAIALLKTGKYDEFNKYLEMKAER